MDGLHCAFCGYVGGIPEMRYTPTGTAALVFSVAVQDKKAAEKGQETTWVRCTVWGERAEELNGNIDKGADVYVEGKLNLNKWTDREGTERTGLNVSAWKVEPMGAIGRRAPKRDREPATGGVR